MAKQQKYSDLTPEEQAALTAAQLGGYLAPRDKALANLYLECNLHRKRAAELSGQFSEQSLRTGGYNARFNRPEVRAYIDKRLEEQVMSADEVLARLSARARVSGADFLERVEKEVPVYEERPLQELIDYQNKQLARLLGLPQTERIMERVEGLRGRIEEDEIRLVLEPEATYQKQVGSRREYEMVPSLEKARENGVLDFIEGVEYTAHGSVKFKWATSRDALVDLGRHFKLFTDRTEVSGQDGGPVQVQITRTIVGGEK